MTNYNLIGSAAKSLLDTQTYNPYPYASPSQIQQMKGVGIQVSRTNPVYEIGYRCNKIAASNRINLYCRTGADNYQHTVGYGNVIIRNFYTDIMEFDGSATDRATVYDSNVENGGLWAVFEYCTYIINNSIWLFTTERDRATQATIRVMLKISTDGLIGRSFGPSIAVMNGATAITDNALWSPYPIVDNNGDIWIYYSVESPTGLYRFKINNTFDGTISSYAKLTSTTMSECAVNAANSTGNLICVFRINSGSTYLQMMTSSNYGATWNAPVSTGLGLVNGIKVQPRILQSSDQARFIVTFMDRGAQSLDKVSSLNLKTSAFSNSYRSVVQLSQNQTNGNGDICLADQNSGMYFYISCTQTSLNAANNMSYWILKDSSTNGPRPWN